MSVDPMVVLGVRNENKKIKVNFKNTLLSCLSISNKTFLCFIDSNEKDIK